MFHSTNQTMVARAAARPANRLICVLAATIVVGCGKSDKIPTTAERLSSVQQKQETQPDFYVPRKTVDYMTDLKSLKDAPVPTKAETAPAKSEPVKTAETKAEPAKIETKTAAAPVQSAPSPAPAPTQTAPAANVVASAAPTARPAPPTHDVTPVVSVIAREQPEFPREAMKAGIESGLVRAKLTISAAGAVTNVEILQAQPARVFDRSVRTALSRWKFNPGADGRSYETEVGFKAAN